MADVILFQPKVAAMVQIPSLPLGLLSISKLLDKEGYKIKIIDQRIDKNWEKHLFQELKKNPICMGVSTIIGLSILNCLEASKIVKENSDIPTVWGGPHPSILPKQTLENEYVDIVCEGEGDITFYELVKALEKNKSLNGVKGLWFKNNGRKNYTGKRPLIDLNEFPDAPFHLLEMKKYKNTTWHLTKDFTACIETSRGCPYNCAYCYNPILYPHWRALTPERVIELMKKIIDDYSVKSFLFQDDNFFVNQKRTNEIMKGIIKEKLDVEMGFQGIRVDIFCRMKKKELNLLYEAGCKYLQFGLETGSPRILKLLNKRTTIKQALSVNKKLTKCPEIYPYYNLMAGFPTETIDDMKMTMDLTIKLKKENPNTQIPTFFLFTPWPMTKLYDLAIEHGFIPPKSLDEWGHVEWVPIKNRPNIRPWLTKDFLKMWKRMSLIIQLSYNPTTLRISNSFIKASAKLYGPVAKFRLNHKLYNFMPETRLVEYAYDLSS